MEKDTLFSKLNFQKKHQAEIGKKSGKRYINNRSRRNVINWPWPRHEHKYTKYKMCLSIMMFVCIKQHLSNVWSWIHEKVKQHWGSVEKSVAYKKVYIQSSVTEKKIRWAKKNVQAKVKLLACWTINIKKIWRDFLRFKNF